MWIWLAALLWMCCLDAGMGLAGSAHSDTAPATPSGVSPGPAAQGAATAGSPPQPPPRSASQTAAETAAPQAKPAEPRTEKAGTLEDRPWLIKQPPINSTRPAAPKNPAEAPAWKNAAQQSLCNEKLAAIRSYFQKSRYYSIQGDACACAENARQFMETEQSIRRECPPDLLAQQGFSSRIVRNIDWLNQLGSQRCKNDGTVSPATPTAPPPKARAGDSAKKPVSP